MPRLDASTLRASVRALALSIAVPTALCAQEIVGTVLLADGTTPVAGVIIEAVRADVPDTRVRALTGARGDFYLRLPQAGVYRVTGLRIGYRPTLLGDFTVGLGERQQKRFVLNDRAVTLARVQVDSAQICGRPSDDSGLMVATLLGQARVALATTLLSAADGAATATWNSFNIITDRLGTPLTPIQIESSESATDRVFRSVDLRLLDRDGYVWDRSDHLQFHAPDAEVLLSERFVSSHCFRLSPPHPEHADWVGVAFAPVEGWRRGRVEISGTLWLDGTSAELRRLEFGYVDLPPRLAAASPRGTVDFLRLSTGIWLVGRWELRLPRLGTLRSQTGEVASERVEQINAISISGGEVSSVRVGNREEFRSGSHPAMWFPEIIERVELPPACRDAPPFPPQHSGILYGRLVDSTGTPVDVSTAVASVQLQWTNVGRGRSTGFAEHRFVSANDGFYIVCGLAIGPQLRVTAYFGAERASEPVTLRLNANRPWGSVDLVIR